jgi:NAD(P)-dependent dehydrogenase (short-subunit alcohol dehydrogenase family)
MGRLDGKVAIVTGSGRGQGRAHAVALAREGADVVCCGIEHDLPGLKFKLWSPGDLDETVRLVEQEDQRAIKVPADVGAFDDMQRVADAAISEFGKIDIMVANAGVVAYAPVQDMTKDEWDIAIHVLLTGVFNSLRVCAPHFISQRSGRFIATSSAVGKMGVGNASNYVAAKWGVIGFIKSAAIDLGQFNVTCNAVCPGYVSTDLLNNDLTTGLFFPDDPAPTMEMVDDWIRANHHFLPVGRLDPSEISKAVVFLASDDARYISGSTVDVSAGMAAIVTA